MNICFFGVGGVGGYYGALMAKKYSSLHTIFFIARGEHKDAINNHGLTLKTDSGSHTITVHPALCTDTVENIPVCDIIILSVKSYDLSGALESIECIADNNTILLPLLNGVDIYDRVRATFSKGIVLPSCVYVGTHLEGPGVVFQEGSNCRLLSGPDPKYPHYNPEPLLGMFTKASIDMVWEINIKTALWTKFIFVASYSLVGAAFGKPLGAIREDRILSGYVTAIMEEIAAIARKMNVILGQNIVDSSFAKAEELPYERRTSLQRDVAHKGTIHEGDLFGGTILRLGTSLAVPTPVSEAIYNKLPLIAIE